jgi:hypothetical protein
VLSTLLWLLLTATNVLVVPGAGLAQESPPIDLWLLVDVSQSMKLPAHLIDAVTTGLGQLLTDSDRFAVYLFSESICEVLSLRKGPHGDRLHQARKVLEAVRRDPLTRVSQCVGSVGSLRSTALIGVWSQTAFKNALIRSLTDRNDIDDRKRVVLVVTDGFDDPLGWYTASGEPSTTERRDRRACPETGKPPESRDHLTANWDCLFLELEENSRKQQQTERALRELMKVTIGPGPVSRYFELAFLWTWSAEQMRLILGESQANAARKTKQFWERLLSRAPFGQFLKETRFFSTEGQAETVVSNLRGQVFDRMRSHPRRVIVTLECVARCSLLVDKGQHTGLIAPIVRIRIRSTYEPDLMLARRGLQVEGLRGKYDGTGILLNHHPRFPDVIEGIRDLGDAGEWAEKLRVDSWDMKVIGEVPGFQWLRVVGSSEGAVVGFRRGAPDTEREYSLVSTSTDIRQKPPEEGYWRIGQDRLRFVSDTRASFGHVGLAFGVSASVKPESLLPVPEAAAPGGFLAVHPQHPDARCRRAPEGDSAICTLSCERGLRRPHFCQSCARLRALNSRNSRPRIGPSVCFL